jgi:catechol 2,3-dioxygenase-like lactoylglutathione lyase family enzyme
MEKRQTALAVAAAAGCLVGWFAHAQIAHGQAQAQRSTPVEGKLSHVAFAVADVEKTAKAFADVFGVEVPKAQDFRDIPWGPRFPGKTMSTRRIGLNINGVSFEFLQPLEGESPWKDFIKKSGDGVHHIGFSVPSVAAAREYLESKGGIQTQQYSDAANYVDMHNAGLPITFEVTPLPPQRPLAVGLPGRVQGSELPDVGVRQP